MSEKKIKILGGILVAFVILGSASVASAQCCLCEQEKSRREERARDEMRRRERERWGDRYKIRAMVRKEEPSSRFSFGLSAGYSHARTQGALAEIKAEFQVRVFRSFRLGFGVGFLGEPGWDRFRDREDEMMGKRDRNRTEMWWRPVRNENAADQHFWSTPLTLTAYYVRNIGRSWDIYALGGAGYYLNRDRDAAVRPRNGWGVHAGLGFDVKLFSRFSLFGEGTYRFVHSGEWHGDERPVQPLPRRMESQNGSRFDRWWDEVVRFFEQAWLPPRKPEPAKINLSGFSLRLGLKAGF